LTIVEIEDILFSWIFLLLYNICTPWFLLEKLIETSLSFYFDLKFI